MCAIMVLKRNNGRPKHHTHQAGLHVCCELALKSAGERNTHGGGADAGNRPRERMRGPVWNNGGDLAA
jgi:hypothetical protein